MIILYLVIKYILKKVLKKYMEYAINYGIFVVNLFFMLTFVVHSSNIIKRIIISL